MKIFVSLFVILFPIFVSADTEIIAPHAPGGPSDMIARAVHTNLPKNEYRIVYKPGAGTLLGINHVMTTNSMLISGFIHTYITNPKIYDNLFYDPDKDLEIIATLAVMPNVLVCHKKTEFKSYNDFVSNTKTLNFGIAGVGSTEHIATEILFNEIKKKHILIPYSQGGKSAVTDLLGGHIDCIFSNYPTVKNFVKEESLVFLISTHKIDSTISWEEKFHKKFPFQSILGIVVNSKLNQETKNKIIVDLQNHLHKSNNKLFELGFFPIISTEKTMIDYAIQNNKETSFLIDHLNIRLKN